MLRHAKKDRFGEAEPFGKSGRVKVPVINVKPVISELRGQLQAVEKAISIFESMAEPEPKAAAQAGLHKGKATPNRREQTDGVPGSRFFQPRAVWLPQHTAALMDFLEADLDLGFTVLQTAAIASDPAHVESALGLVRKSLATVHRFRDQIEDPGAKGAIDDRACQLELQLRTFESPEKDGDTDLAA